MALTTNISSWETATFDALIADGSVAAVRDTLSKAVKRTPQSALWKAVRPHMEQLLQSAAGVSMLAALVEYCTIRTIDELCEALAALKVSLATADAVPLVAELSDRVDSAKSESRDAVLTAVGTAALAQLREASGDDDATPRALIAAVARHEPLHAAIQTQLATAAFAKTIARDLAAPRKQREVSRFAESMLKQSEGTEGFSAAMSKVFFSAVQPQLATPEALPPVLLVTAIARYGDLATVAKLSAKLAASTAFGKLCRGPFAAPIRFCLERTTETAPKAVVAMAEAVFAELKEEKLTKSSVAAMKLLAAVQPFVAKTIGTDDNARLTAAAEITAQRPANLLAVEAARGRAAASKVTRPKPIAVVDSDSE